MLEVCLIEFRAAVQRELANFTTGLHLPSEWSVCVCSKRATAIMERLARVCGGVGREVVYICGGVCMCTRVAGTPTAFTFHIPFRLFSHFFLIFDSRLV